MSDLRDLFKVVAEGKKATIDSSPGKKLLGELNTTLREDNPFSKKPEVLTEADPTPKVTPASQQYSPQEIAKSLDVDATFQQPNPAIVAPEMKAVQSKLKFLEQAIGKIVATGPCSGEVRLRYLDDVDRSSISDGKYMKYDSATQLFTFDVPTLSLPSNLTLSTLQVGDIDSGNYTEFQEDGSLVANGDATCFRDEMNELVKAAANNPGSRLVYNFPEASLVFKSNATEIDYAIMNIQINHDWKTGTNLEPHLHWWQSTVEIPNWVIQYRIQPNGSLKTTEWTPLRWTNSVFDYTGGTLNQIISFGEIVPPTDPGVSMVLQVRLLRDTTNSLGLFDTVDPVLIDVSATSFDIHIEVDMFGSRQRYIK